MRRGKTIIATFIAAVVLFPMAVFASDDMTEGAHTQIDVAVDELSSDFGVVDISNDRALSEVIDELNQNSEIEREIPEQQDAAQQEQVTLKQKSVKKAASNNSYTYKITPLLPPFNDYFFVETNNPDPKSFRFADKSSSYSSGSLATISWDRDDWNEYPNLYADVRYDDPKTGRVNGGYLFCSSDTDGGQIVLQVTDNADDWDPVWKDTSVKATLPALVDNADYLIKTYATKDGFFENMDAVQNGFSSICLYSGSYIRGKLIKPDKYWNVSIAGHIDQSFYIFSPYERESSKPLFASAIYPFRYDSLGFPGMMASVAKRLDSSASCEWSSTSHAHVNVTYKGETRSYGGQGNGEGKGISEDKILQYFTFGSNGTKISLVDAHSLLENYAVIEMDDDIPREDSLTWNQIYDTVGGGAWTRVSRGGGTSAYAFFYQDGPGTSFSADEWGVGYSIYWGGDLGYARDTWVDGRYVGEWRYFVPGERFEKHPTSDIILMNQTVPQINYDARRVYNNETSKYEIEYSNIIVSEDVKTVLFQYDNGVWKASYGTFDNNCADYDDIEKMTENGLIDGKYLEMVTIRQNEIEALDLDRNTEAMPDKGYIYDGIEQPGKDYDHARGHCWNQGEYTEDPTCLIPGEKCFTCLVCGEKRTETAPATGHDSPLKHVAAKPATCMEEGNTEYWYCSKCERCFADKAGKKEIEYYSWEIWDWNHNWKHVRVPAGLLKTGKEYDQCTICKEKVNVKNLPGYAHSYVKAFKVTKAKKAFTAKWKKQSKANRKKFNGYQIRYSTKSSMKGARYVKAGKSSTSKKIRGLKKKTKYYVQVRTYTSSKGVKYYSKWSAKKSVRTK